MFRVCVCILEQDFIVSNSVNGEKCPEQIGKYVFEFDRVLETNDEK